MQPAPLHKPRASGRRVSGTLARFEGVGPSCPLGIERAGSVIDDGPEQNELQTVEQERARLHPDEANLLSLADEEAISSHWQGPGKNQYAVQRHGDHFMGGDAEDVG